MITADLLRSLLKYDSETGIFTWIASHKKPKAGQAAGTVDRDGYIIIRHGGRGYKAHRLAWLYVYGEWPTGMIDHINRVRHDNRIANLRCADASLNAQNHSHKPGCSGLPWVTWFSQYGKWKASFTHNKRVYFVGHFDCKHQAYEQVCAAREKIVGVNQ